MFILPLGNWVLTQEFGLTGYAKAHPQRYKRVGGIHEGVDASAEIGTDVLATADGIAIEDYDPFWGKYIRIDHLNFFASYLCHLSQILKLGNVKKGDIIALTGNTGNVAPHLHWSVKKDRKFVNPLVYLDKQETDDSNINNYISKEEINMTDEQVKTIARAIVRNGLQTRFGSSKIKAWKKAGKKTVYYDKEMKHAIPNWDYFLDQGYLGGDIIEV